MRASTRDYKRRQKPSLELWKMREFGMGALSPDQHRELFTVLRDLRVAAGDFEG